MDGREAARWLVLFALLIVGYFAYDKIIVGTGKAFGITREMKGEIISVEAQVVSLSSGKGHLFSILRDPANQKMIKGVLFKNDDAPEENRRQKELLEARFKDGGLVAIDGTVAIYDGELELIIGKAR